MFRKLQHCTFKNTYIVWFLFDAQYLDLVLLYLRARHIASLRLPYLRRLEAPEDSHHVEV